MIMHFLLEFLVCTFIFWFKNSSVNSSASEPVLYFITNSIGSSSTTAYSFASFITPSSTMAFPPHTWSISGSGSSSLTVILFFFLLLLDESTPFFCLYFSSSSSISSWVFSLFFLFVPCPYAGNSFECAPTCDIDNKLVGNQQLLLSEFFSMHTTTCSSSL